MVDDQEKALRFYTEKLGFVKKMDIAMGEYRWLTLVSPVSEEIELLLEPLGFEAAETYQKALLEAGIPFTAFHVTDMNEVYHDLLKKGVEFTKPPTPAGAVTIAILKDTCGNLLQLVQA